MYVTVGEQVGDFLSGSVKVTQDYGGISEIPLSQAAEHHLQLLVAGLLLTGSRVVGRDYDFP